METKIIITCILVVVWAFISTGFSEVDSGEVKQMATKMYRYVYNPIGLAAFNCAFLAALFKVWK